MFDEPVQSQATCYDQLYWLSMYLPPGPNGPNYLPTPQQSQQDFDHPQYNNTLLQAPDMTQDIHSRHQTPHTWASLAPSMHSNGTPEQATLDQTNYYGYNDPLRSKLASGRVAKTHRRHKDTSMLHMTQSIDRGGKEMAKAEEPPGNNSLNLNASLYGFDVPATSTVPSSAMPSTMSGMAPYLDPSLVESGLPISPQSQISSDGGQWDAPNDQSTVATTTPIDVQVPSPVVTEDDSQSRSHIPSPFHRPTSRPEYHLREQRLMLMLKNEWEGMSWDMTATALGTNRTSKGMQVHYSSRKLRQVIMDRQWSNDVDADLVEIVEEHMDNLFKTIAKRMNEQRLKNNYPDNRDFSELECFMRYRYLEMNEEERVFSVARQVKIEGTARRNGAPPSDTTIRQHSKITRSPSLGKGSSQSKPRKTPQLPASSGPEVTSKVVDVAGS